MFGMEMAETLKNASYISLGLSVLFLLLTVLLFFRYKIRNVIRELSGKERLESTRKMKEGYAFSGTLRQTTVSSGEIYEHQIQGLLNTDQLVSSPPVPSSGTAETGVMRQKTKTSSGRIGKKAKTFTVTKNMIEIHTDESIL